MMICGNEGNDHAPDLLSLISFALLHRVSLLVSAVVLPRPVLLDVLGGVLRPCLPHGLAPFTALLALVLVLVLPEPRRELLPVQQDPSAAVLGGPEDLGAQSGLGEELEEGLRRYVRDISILIPTVRVLVENNNRARSDMPREGVEDLRRGRVDARVDVHEADGLAAVLLEEAHNGFVEPPLDDLHRLRDSEAVPGTSALRYSFPTGQEGHRV
mmetsp:Transcript_6096/g.20968  ORF Transcript_6096/g.20968 Transcript_6096/m.20968 type:complete len:213 (-) Transcript_6096:439-1077(-)